MPLDRVAQVLAAGEVELAIAGTPSLLSAKGVQIVGPLPGELQNWFVNTAGVSATAKEPDAARALIKHLDDTRGRSSHQGERHGVPRSVTDSGGRGRSIVEFGIMQVLTAQASALGRRVHRIMFR